VGEEISGNSGEKQGEGEGKARSKGRALKREVKSWQVVGDEEVIVAMVHHIILYL
jgi:hypothetical protein